MKRLCLLISIVFVTIAAMAQDYSRTHVFQNNYGFKTFKNSEIKSMDIDGDDGNFDKLIISKKDGSTYNYNLKYVDSLVFRQTDLPEFHINLIDYPDLKELNANWGKEYIYKARLRMDGNGMYDDLAEQEVEFRGRGNSTWWFNKKPYRFKMAKKASVCELNKAKSFVLIANYIDCSLMRNAVALWLGRYLGMPFTNHSIPVKVYLNENFKGAYMLTEKIGIGGGSVDIDEKKGMLFELDSWFDEEFQFYFNLSLGYSVKSSTVKHDHSLLPVMVKDPDIREICADNGKDPLVYFSDWMDDFTNMGKAVMNAKSNESLSDYIDIESAANFILVNFLAGNRELCHPKSCYMYKGELGSGDVYHFGPLWDFDWAYSYSANNAESTSPKSPLLQWNADNGGATFYKKVVSNAEVMALYRQKWNDFVSVGYPLLLEFMEEYASLIEPSAVENGILWTETTNRKTSYKFRKNYEALKTWIDDRIKYANSHRNLGLYE